MSTPNAVLLDAFGRVGEEVPEVVRGLSVGELLWRPDPDANHIAWLVWHLTRILDDHVADVGGVEQVWTAQGWAARFGLDYPDDAVGYGHSSAQVGAFALPDPALLVGYHAAAAGMANAVVADLDDVGLERIVDERWDPPVTAAVRLVSVSNDIAQHIGQAAYVRGLVLRRR
jgi:hypothetical protein